MRGRREMAYLPGQRLIEAPKRPLRRLGAEPAEQSTAREATGSIVVDVEPLRETSHSGQQCGEQVLGC